MIKVKIGLVELERLKPHEKTVESRVIKVLNSLISTKTLIRPLILDEKTLTVIDGAHRLKALRKLGLKVVPALLVDYLEEEEIRVDRWVRVYVTNPDNIGNILSLIKTRFEGHVDIVGSDKSVRVLIDQNLGAEAYRILEVLENSMAGRIPIKYLARDWLKLEPHTIVLVPPILSKNEVVEAALNENPYPPKTTRHVTILKRVKIGFKLNQGEARLMRGNFILGPYQAS
ncbi:MAG: ParB N-terminal domain-containing protein [Sulfolobales archaeon]